MGMDALKRFSVNNRSFFWRFVRRSKNYSICEINPKAYFRGCLVNNRGQNNRIVVEEGAKVAFSTFSLVGDNNTIFIRKNASLNGCVFLINDHGNTIEIGESTTVTGKTEFIATEGTRITVGADCMFAYGIVLRTGDHHSIFNSDGQRINASRDIILGNHVWIGQNAFLLKGVEIQSGCVVGACSVVTKGPGIENAILAGNPAKVIKTDISWERELI